MPNNDIFRIIPDFKSQLCEFVTAEFSCTICAELLINAYHGPCGCRYCLKCITDFLNGKDQYCPGEMDYCREDMLVINENVHPDKSIDIRISRLIVTCPAKSCDFKDQLKNMGEHMRICKGRTSACPFSTIGCNDTKIEEDKMDDHLHLEINIHSTLLVESMNHVSNDIESLKKDFSDLSRDVRGIKAVEERAEAR